MRLIIRLIIWLLGVVLLLGVTAGILLVSMVNSAWMKDEIRYYARQYTGKDIIINGKLQASFYPGLGVKANEVVIADPQGGEPLLLAKDIIISAKLAPLFQRKFEINNIILHDATLNMGSKSALRDLNVTTGSIKENQPVHLKSDFSYWQENALVTRANIETNLSYLPKTRKLDLDKLALSLKLSNQPKIQINGAVKLDLANLAMQSQELHLETADHSLAAEITAIKLRMPKGGNNIVGTLEAQSLGYQKYLLKNLHAQIAYSNKQLVLKDMLASLFGGKLAGNISANFAGSEPAYAINQKLSNVHLDQLLATLGGKTKLTGLTNLSMNLHASGSGAAFKATLNGNMNIAISNGVIYGTDLDYKIDQAIIKYTKRAAKVADTGSTRFTSLNATASVNNGELSTDNLVFLTPKIRVKGEGNLNLNNEQVKINLTCRLLNQEDVHMQFLGVKINTDLAMYDIPATVGCKISEPCVAVNITALLTELAKTQGSKAVEDVVKRGLINKVIKDQKLNDALQKLLPF